MPEMKRREFLKLLGMSASGMALSGCDWPWKIPDRLIREARRGPGKESFVHSVCHLCPAGCGIRVRLVDRIPVHIDGNPMHPINHGGICPHGAAGLDFLYHPDRLHRPMARIGPKGGGRWKEIEWEAALGEVAGRLKALRQAGKPEKIAFLLGEERGLMHETVVRFMEHFGSPNVLTLDEERHDALPFELLFGWKELPEYDLANARFVLSLGSNLLEDGPSPVHAIFAYRKMREAAEKKRGRLVHVDSRHSLTAASADLFLPIRPGTHGAFALGVAYVLIKERYLDVAFLERYTSGFEGRSGAPGPARPGFREQVLKNYYPERAAQITGVPSRRIVEVAREFGRARPALAAVGGLATEGTNGFFNSLCALSLNVLVGNVEKKGGLRMARPAPFKRMAPVQPDAVARRGLERAPLHDAPRARFPLRPDGALLFTERCLAEKESPVDLLFVHGSNPAFGHPYARQFRAALERIPFVVSFASIRDETSEYADLILPDHSPMEKWLDSGDTPGVAFAHAAVSPPILEPLYDTRHSGDVLIALAGAAGVPAAGGFPEKDFLSLLKNRFMGIFRSGEGTLISGSFEESWVQFLKQRGWQNLVYESFEDFWKLLAERGGWWDPLTEEIPPGDAIRTAGKKIPFFSTRLAEELERAAAPQGGAPGADAVARTLSAWGVREERETAFFPHFEEPRWAGNEETYPYTLVTFGLLSSRKGAGAFSPLLQEMFGYHQRVSWDSWAEIHPETAHRLHVAEGETVAIVSEAGSIETRVVFNHGLEQRVVAVPFGMGHTSSGRYAEGIGVNPYEIAAQANDPLWGKPARVSTRVAIRKPRGRGV